MSGNEIDSQSEKVLVSDAKGLGKYFQLDVTLKLFGYVIWEWHFPPKN